MWEPQVRVLDISKLMLQTYFQSKQGWKESPEAKHFWRDRGTIFKELSFRPRDAVCKKKKADLQQELENHIVLDQLVLINASYNSWLEEEGIRVAGISRSDNTSPLWLSPGIRIKGMQ